MHIKRYDTIIVDGVKYGKLKNNKDYRVFSYKGDFVPSHLISFFTPTLKRMYKYEFIQHYLNKRLLTTSKSIIKVLSNKQKFLTYTPVKEAPKERKKQALDMGNLEGVCLRCFDNKVYKVLKVDYQKGSIKVQTLPTGKVLTVPFHELNAFYNG